MYYSVSETGMLLGVCPATIRRWDGKGKIRCIRTVGNHRRIHRDEIQRIIEGRKRRYRNRGAVIYARVSAYDQKKNGDLDRQVAVLQDYCSMENLEVKYVITDLGSGLRANRKGLKKLFTLICKGKVDRVVISYKDRLTRFGFEYPEYFFKSYGVEIICTEAKENVSL